MKSLLRWTGEYPPMLRSNQMMTSGLGRGAGWKKKAKCSVRAMSYWDRTKWRENMRARIYAKRSVSSRLSILSKLTLFRFPSASRSHGRKTTPPTGLGRIRYRSPATFRGFSVVISNQRFASRICQASTASIRIANTLDGSNVAHWFRAEFSDSPGYSVSYECWAALSTQESRLIQLGYFTQVELLRIGYYIPFLLIPRILHVFGQLSYVIVRIDASA